MTTIATCGTRKARGRMRLCASSLPKPRRRRRRRRRKRRRLPAAQRRAAGAARADARARRGALVTWTLPSTCRYQLRASAASLSRDGRATARSATRAHGHSSATPRSVASQGASSAAAPARAAGTCRTRRGLSRIRMATARGIRSARRSLGACPRVFPGLPPCRCEGCRLVRVTGE